MESRVATETPCFKINVNFYLKINSMIKMWKTLIVGTRVMGKQGIMNGLLKSHLGWDNLDTKSSMSQWTGQVPENERDSIEYMALPEERIDEALAVLENSMRREPVAMAFGLYDNASSVEQMKLLHREVMKDRCSIIAVEKQTGQIAGVSVNKIRVLRKDGELDPLQEFTKNNVTDEVCLGMIELLEDVESRVDIFQYYNVQCILELYDTGIDSRFANLGIGKTLVGASLEFGRRLSKGERRVDVNGNDIVTPQAAFLVCTSSFSQRVATSNNFKWLATVSYDEYFHRGKKLSETIGDVNKTMKLGGMRLDETPKNLRRILMSQ